MESNKRLILRLGVILVCALLLLTFFSNTIYSFNLAIVSAGFPSDGVIMRTNRADGIADFKISEYLYTEAAGRITLSVRTGEAVSKGDLLFTLRSDMEDLRELLTSETERLEKLSLNLEQIEKDFNYRQNALDNLKPEEDNATEVPFPDISSYDYEAERLSAEIENAAEEYEALLLLYEAGAAAKEALTKAEAAIESLEKEYRRNDEKKEKVMEEYKKAVEKAAENDKKFREERQKAYETERRSMLKAIDDLRYQKQTYALDENAARRSINRINEQLEAGGVVTVYAEADGVVRETAAGVETGAYIDRNRLVMRIGATTAADGGYPYCTAVLFPESVDYLSIGDNVRLNIKSSGQYGLTGVVEKLGSENGRLRADIVFNAASLTGGEKVEAIAEFISQLYQTSLPNSAIREDELGNYVLCVERVPNSIMGYSYYARKKVVFIYMQDEKKTAFSAFTEITDPIIINSDRPVADGDRVRLVNGSEFIGTR